MDLGRIVPPRLGYRGAALICIAVVWALIGWDVLDAPDPDPRYRLPIEYLPTEFRVAVWWVASACAFIFAWWPPGRADWGFVALVVPPTFRALSYGGAATFGVPDTWRACFIWLFVTAYILVLSAWPEPPVKPTGRHRAGGR